TSTAAAPAPLVSPAAVVRKTQIAPPVSFAARTTAATSAEHAANAPVGRHNAKTASTPPSAGRPTVLAARTAPASSNAEFPTPPIPPPVPLVVPPARNAR